MNGVIYNAGKKGEEVAGYKIVRGSEKKGYCFVAGENKQEKHVKYDIFKKGAIDKEPENVIENLISQDNKSLREEKEKLELQINSLKTELEHTKKDLKINENQIKHYENNFAEKLTLPEKLEDAGVALLRAWLFMNDVDYVYNAKEETLIELVEKKLNENKEQIEEIE